MTKQKIGLLTVAN